MAREHDSTGFAADGAGLSRRGFLKSCAAASGGLVIALYLPGCSKPESVSQVAESPKAIVANAWLRIGGDGSITVLCDRSEMGQGVYTALPTLIAEELGVAPTDVRIEFAPSAAEYVNTLLGTQATGGSTSVRNAWDRLRMAGAEARARLVAAAAGDWGVEPQDCSVADGFVICGDRRSSFGELVEAAAAMQAPDSVHLKDKSEFRYIGKTTPRLDTPSKVDGSARFGIDVRLPGMLYAALAQPPTLGGSVGSFEAGAAEGMPGVRHVVQTSGGVAVIADSWWQAKMARDALEIQWTAGPNAKLDNAAIYAGLEAASGGTGESVRSEGNVESALQAADRRVDAVYELPMLAHATLEPQNVTVEFRDDGCHVHAPTQAQQFAQNAAAGAAGLPLEQVFIHTTFLGGGFGRRLDVDFIAAGVECAKAAGVPVKLLWTREDDTSHDKYRPPARNSMAAGFDASGKLDAVKIHLVAPSITARWAPAAVADAIDPFAIEAAHNFPYDVANLEIDYLRHEIGIDVGYWRSVSHALNCFTIESFRDELATEADEDPYEFRRNLLEKQPRWRAVLEAAADKARWAQPAEGRHLGLALMSGYDTYLAQVAEISVEGNRLEIHRIVCVIDCGQMVNPGIVLAQAEGSVVFGLSAALFGEINIVDGKVREQNFHNYRLLRINEVPKIEVHLMESGEKPGGMGEPVVALVAPAVCNAIYSATGKRLRKLPITKQGFTI